jgi:hypothetical protein
MLSRSIGPSFNSTFVTITTVTFQKELQVLSSAKPAYRANISGHYSLLLTLSVLNDSWFKLIVSKILFPTLFASQGATACGFDEALTA